MGMYDEIILDQENTIIILCKHMRRLVTLLKQYKDIESEEKFLDAVEEKNGIDEEDDNG